MAPERHPSSQAFHDLLESVGEMHDRKQADYGSKRDPFLNIRATEPFGIPAWCATVVRMNDKQVRLMIAMEQTVKGGAPRLSNEGVRDSLLDQAVYSLIGHVMYDEWEARGEKQRG